MRNRQMKGMRSITSGTILGAAAIFCGLILVFIDANFGIIRPFPDDYDETKYVDVVCADRSIVINQGLVGFTKGLLSEDRDRPPGYRLAGFLVGLASEPSPAMLRSLSLLSLFVTALLLFLSGTEISGTHAGILWAGAFSFSVGVFSAALNFGTETTLYPALAGCLYAVARWFHKVRPDAVTVGVLVLATALGSLSKVSFFFVFLPLIGAALVFAAKTGQPRRSLLAILGAVAGGLLLTIPWWVVNWWSALAYAYWVRHFPGANYPWLPEAATNLLGVPFAIGLLIFLGWILVRANSLWKISDRATWNFVAVCLCGCLPLIVLQIVSANHNVRLITPALIPGMGVIAVLLNLASVLKRRAVSAFIGLLFGIQIGTIAWHISQSSPQDPWDWGELRELTRAYGLSNPTIIVVGEMATLNPPQIQYPWLCHGETLFEPLWLLPERLLGSKDRQIGWSKVNSLIEQADIVLTVPGRLFQSSLDGQINDELARRLLERSDIWTLVNLYLGVDSETAISVFLRKRVQ